MHSEAQEAESQATIAALQCTIADLQATVALKDARISELETASASNLFRPRQQAPKVNPQELNG